MIVEGDCVEVMASMEENSVDAIVTDPPYGLEFMGKEWDSFPLRDRHRKTGSGKNTTANGFANGVKSVTAGYAAQAWHELWAREAFRVLKPGGHMLAFGGTRTYHRLTCAIEDAGFEIRDTIQWIYGSGFNKVGKTGKKMYSLYSQKHRAHGLIPTEGTETMQRHMHLGGSLKPAHEPIVMARKPISEKSVARQVLETGTGALNIDGCRVGVGHAYTQEQWSQKGASRPTGTTYGDHKGSDTELPSGRWPANLMWGHHEDCEATGGVRRVRSGGAVRKNGISDASMWAGDGGGFKNRGPEPDAGYGGPDGTEEVAEYRCVEGCPVKELDEQSGQLQTDKHKPGKVYGNKGTAVWGNAAYDVPWQPHQDKGGASRYFQQFDSEPGFKYVAKASAREKNAGLEGVPKSEVRRHGDRAPDVGRQPQVALKESNHHPTVKPVNLMRYLVRLVTPPGGTVLDPFCGSGSTGCAAVQEGLNFIGIEKEPEYAHIARRRIAYWSQPDYLRDNKPPTKSKQRTSYGTFKGQKHELCPENGAPLNESAYECGCDVQWLRRPDGAVYVKPDTQQSMDTLF